MPEAALYKKLEGSRVRCDVCQWHCEIGPDKLGLCKARRNINGTLEVLNYARVSSIASDPIEKKPLFHFFPGTNVLSLGTLGCNFHCIHCQNWHIACVDDPEEVKRLRTVTPEQTIELVKQYNCQGVSWTYNEPSVWFEYTLDSARLARQHKVYSVYVTNGYLSAEALDMIGPYLDAWRVDVKGFSDTAYQRLAKVKKWQGILDVARRAKEKWGMHVEIVTNVIPTINDDDLQLESLAKWIKDNLGELTPWHVTRFYPQYKLTDIPATPVKTLEKAWEIGKKAGLKFVYLGNVAGNEKENTVCYQCGKTIIKRMGYNIQIIGLDDSKCKFCGADLNVRKKLK